MLKSMFRMFGVALMAVLSLMAALAISAQGANLSDGGASGNFTVLGNPNLVGGTQFTGTTLHLIILIQSKNAYILCNKGKISGTGLNSAELLFDVLLEECAAFNDTTKVALGACPVLGEPAAGHIRMLLIALARLHEGKLYVLFHGHKIGGIEQPIAEIKFGPECGIGVKVKQAGLLAAEVDNGNSVTEHLFTFNEAIQKLLGARALYGAAELFMTGVWHVKPTGDHLSCTWAVL